MSARRPNIVARSGVRSGALLATLACALLAAPAHGDDTSLHPSVFPGPVEVSIPTADLSDELREYTGQPIHNDNGKHLVVRWRAPSSSGSGDRALVFRTRAKKPDPSQIRAVLGTVPEPRTRYGDFTLVAITEDTTLVDEVEPDGTYTYLVVIARPSIRMDAPALAGARSPAGASGGDAQRVIAISQPALSEAIEPRAALFNIDRWFFLAIIALMAAALFLYTRRVKAKGGNVFIRRIPGVDAIEEAVGRSTEMGRPVLYVTGVEEIQNIQTIASLLILGHVAEMTAEYDTDIKVANFFPLTMVVAEEIVRQGYANAGRIDAHKPENVMFISAEQFAFAAGVNGLILRDRPATNIYLGRFFAESLILAETGYVTKAIQIAGTAEITQLPFFIAACDYTIIGEELYAVSAYLSREPSLLATLKATDAVKVIIIGLVLLGTVGATAGWFDLGPWLVP